MAKLTGRARSIQRRAQAKARKKRSSGSVAGASTSSGRQSDALRNLSIRLANNPPAGGSARGDDFASSGGGDSIRNDVIDTTPRTKEELENASFDLRGGGGGSRGPSLAQQRAELAAKFKRARDDRDRRTEMRAGGRLASDNLRASNVDTTEGDRVTDGAQSSGGEVDQTKRTGAGTVDNPLTDIQIQDLTDQGILEGDNMPGRGILTPMGTFRSEAEVMAEQVDVLSEQDVTPTDGIVSSDAPIVEEETEALDSINDAAKVVRDLTYLDEEIKNIQAEMKNEMEIINAQAKLDAEAMKNTQAGETGQTAVGLANAGGFLGFSGSGTGVMLTLAKSHRTELQSLDARRKQAIFQAQQAARENRFDLVKLKAEELQQIEQETYNREQDYLNRVRVQTEKTQAKQERAQTETSIFEAIQGGATTVAGIFAQLGGSVDIATISKFLENITPEGREGLKFSATQNAALLGSGMNFDDIAALSEYVGANGYDDTIKGMLTPGQRAAADKIFSTGAIGTGTGANFSPDKRNRLEQAGLLDAPRQEQLDFLYGGEKSTEDPFKSVYTSQVMDGLITVDSLPAANQEDTRNELLDLGFGSPVVPQWYKDGLENQPRIEFTSPYGAFISTNVTTGPMSQEATEVSWEKYRNTALGELF